MRNSREIMLENLIKENFPFLEDDDFRVYYTPAERNMYLDKEEYCVVVKAKFYHKLAGLDGEKEDYVIKVLKRDDEKIATTAYCSYKHPEKEEADEVELLLKRMHKHRQEAD